MDKGVPKFSQLAGGAATFVEASTENATAFVFVKEN